MMPPLFTPAPSAQRENIPTPVFVRWEPWMGPRTMSDAAMNAHLFAALNAASSVVIGGENQVAFVVEGTPT